MFETDRSIIERCRNGENEAFGRLYDRYKRSIFSFCMQILGNRESAEDALHEAFLRAAKGLASLRNPDLFRSWIFQIARNEALGMKRSRRDITVGEMPETVEQHHPGIEAERNDLAEILQSGIARLRPGHREVILLREYHQLTYEEIAEITGASMSAVKSRLFKARKELIQHLSPYLKMRE